MQACVFERPDRARALLYRVMEENLNQYRSELEHCPQNTERPWPAEL